MILYRFDNNTGFNKMDSEYNMDKSSMMLTQLRVEAEEKLAYRLGFGIHLYYFPIISVFGLLGNILSLSILLQARNRKFPCYRTLIALSFSDLLIIINGYYYWVLLLLDIMSETHCKIWTYFFQTAGLSSALLVVFVTTHKYLAFLSPFKSHKWRSPERTVKIIVVIVVCSTLFSIVHIFSTNTLDGKLCVGITSVTFYGKVLSWSALIWHAVLPVTFVIAMNLLIVKALYLSNKFCQSSVRSKTNLRWHPPGNVIPQIHQTSPKNPLRHYDKSSAIYHRQSALLLVTVTGVFAVLTPPLYIMYFVYSFVDATTDADAYAYYVLVYFTCLDLYITNSCINFFLYMGAGTKFRQDVKKLFTGTRLTRQSVSSVRSLTTNLKSSSTESPRSSPNLSGNLSRVKAPLI